MKVSMKWIHQYAPINVTPAEYESRMVMSGNGVEGIEALGARFSNVVVGRVLTCDKHPNSDHLHVCTVDVGADAPLQIVCGAPNVAAGQLVPVALVGAVIDGHEIKHGVLRGVASDGMLCSSAELGVPQELYPGVGEAGLLIFHEEYPVGSDVKPIFGLDDYAVDFEILANRPDCLSVFGLARETAAVLQTKLSLPEITVKEAGGDITNYARVTVDEPTLCPRYAARVIDNVRIGPSPMWMRAYLHAAGMRSINNIVDITNIVMLETGHPMHAFDLTQVRGRHIIVRKARAGEHLKTLDGKEHALSGRELLICDEDGATGLAGIMGGEESEITEHTTQILFECATFDRATTRIAARGLGIRTESSGRFERGVSARTIRTALDRACQLVNLLNAGDVVGGVIDLYPNAQPPQVVTASCARIARRTGVDIPPQEVVSTLKRLYFDVKQDGDTLTVTVPEYRQDIDGEADLCEEVLRLAGYDRIPCTSLRGETRGGGRSAVMKANDKTRALLSGLGYCECMNYSFLSPKLLEKLGLEEGDARLSPVRIRNPLGEDTSCMRTTLEPYMLQVLSLNMNRGNDSALLYELGTVFSGTQKTEEGLPVQTQMLCLAKYGKDCDFYSLRGDVLALLEAFGVSCELVPGGEPFHHPGRSARLVHDGVTLCTLGETHPDINEKFDLPQRAYIAQISLDTLYACAEPMGHVKPLPRTPAVSRDIALVLPDSQPLGPVMAAIRRAGGALLEELTLFDVYRGAQVGQGLKSAAFSLLLRAPDHTLTDAEITAVTDKVRRSCKAQFGAEIRA